MKIEEARRIYSGQILNYNGKRTELTKKRQELDEKIKNTENGAVVYKNDAAVLELQLDAVEKKRQEYQDYMEKLMEQHMGLVNAEVSKQQGDAMAEYAKDVSKIMIVARRLMKGEKVPSKDEQKLMEYDPKLYTMAKNAGALAKVRKRKEHKSLWEEEEEKTNVDPNEKADNAEAFASGPQVVEVEDTIAQATADMPEADISFE